MPTHVWGLRIANVNVYPLARGVSKDVFFVDNLLNQKKRILAQSQSLTSGTDQTLFGMSNLAITSQNVWPPYLWRKTQLRGASENVAFLSPFSTFYASIKGSSTQDFLCQWALILGDFHYFPYYVAFGQHSAGFGLYYTRGIEKPLTSQLAAMPNKANISLGWKTAWGELGDIQVLSSFFQNEATLGIQYYTDRSAWCMKTGMSYATNVVNERWQSLTDTKSHFINAYWMLNKCPIQLVLEGITTLSSFQQDSIISRSPCNRPIAINAEASYRRVLFDQPVTMTANWGYGAGYLHGIRFDGVDVRGMPVKRVCVSLKMPIHSPHIQFSLGYKRESAADQVRQVGLFQLELISS